MIPTNELIKLLKKSKIIDVQYGLFKLGHNVSANALARLKSGDMTVNHSVIVAVSDYFEL